MGLIFKKSTAQPAFTVAAAITGTTEATQTLTCAYTVVRARAVNVTVRWYRHTASDGSDPTGVLLGTGNNYTLTGTDVGNYIRAIVTAINPAGEVRSTTSYTSAITSGDPPTPPVLVTPAEITGTADVDETLTVTYSFTGQDSVAIQWYSYSTEAGDDAIALGTAATQALTESESGRWIGVTVTATNTVDSTVTSDIVAMAGTDPGAPLAPTAYNVPDYDDSALEKIYAFSGDDLQAKINQLGPGKCLVIQAGATFTGSYYVSSSVADGTDWVYIVSSQVANLPEGTRVSESDATSMAKLTSATGSYTLALLSGAKKVRFAGLEIQRTASASFITPVGWNTVGASSPYDWTGITQADEIIFDRCWVHGGTTTQIVNGFVGYAVKQWAITECLVTDIHHASSESHGVHFYGSEGPQKLHNSRIEGAGINVFVGDNYSFTSDPAFGLKVVKDLTITKNHIVKPLEWDQNLPEYNGNNWIVKNNLEVKFGERILIEGNVIEHSWSDAQAGFLLLLTSIRSPVRDVKIANNVFRNATAGFQLSPSAGLGNANSRLERVLIENNVIYDLRFQVVTQPLLALSIDGNALVEQESNYITYRNNTCAKAPSLKSAYNIYYSGATPRVVTNNLRIYNNISPAGAYGIQSNSNLEAGLDVVVGSGAVYSNLLYGYNTFYDFGFTAKSGEDDVAYDNIWVGPSLSATNAEPSVHFTDNTFDDLTDFVLTSSSPGYQAGVGGVDIGADITELASAINASDF